MLHTTFNLLRKEGACSSGYGGLARALGGVRAYGKDTPIPLIQVLDIRGLDDALWCLQCVLPSEVEGRDRQARLLACDYAELMAHFWVAVPGVLWQPADTISVSRRYARGQATPGELAAARTAASLAVRIAAEYEGFAAWAARLATRTAAEDAGWAAWAARPAARTAAEREWQIQRFREMLEGRTL